MSTSTANISAAVVKDLREKTGAPMMDCKSALLSQGRFGAGDCPAAQARCFGCGQESDAYNREGAVASYIHAGGKIGVLVEVNCESDFVARTEDFKELVHDIAMHIAASDPKYIRKEDVTPEAFEREKEIYRAQAATTGKPAQVIEKIVEGKMSKFYEEVCLLEQPFIKDQTMSIGEMIAQKVGKLGENIAVRRFARFKVGDGERHDRRPPSRRPRAKSSLISREKGQPAGCPFKLGRDRRFPRCSLEIPALMKRNVDAS